MILFQLNLSNGYEQYRVEADAIARQQVIGGEIEEIEIPDPVDEPPPVVNQWTDLENALTSAEFDASRFADILSDWQAYSAERQEEFNQLLEQNGFPRIVS